MRSRPHLRRLTALLAVPLVAGVAACALAADPTGTSQRGPQDPRDKHTATVATGHPRLLVRQKDLPRLRKWAAPGNPIYARGLAVLARNAKRRMDSGTVPAEDTGLGQWEQYPTEWYAELFAFMSLIDPSQKARADYGRRARKLMMYVIKKAEPGAGAEGEPFRDPYFSTSNRSRWQGEAFPLTLDWAYEYFSSRDKLRIRKVFLRWAKEKYRGYPLIGVDLRGALPSPSRKANDPALVGDRRSVRWSLNNYYIAHARNLGLMAMALDQRDDPGGRLRGELKNVTGSWLYVIDEALRTEARGGLSPEGFEYGSDALGRLAQLLVAMRTAGKNGAAAGRQARIAENSFWADSIAAFLHSLPQRPTRLGGDYEYMGDVFQPAWYGDAETYWQGDPISLFGPLGLEAADRGDTKTVNAVRWIQTHVPPGGKDGLADRVGNTDQFFNSILYFLLFDPKAPEPSDPRRGMETRWVAPAIDRTLARTCWCDDARIFAHKLGWNTIDHQTADGNDFGFSRRGEWLTKSRTHYASVYTDFTNSITIANDEPESLAPDDYRRVTYERGGQYILNPAGDPPPAARSLGDGFVALTGDATNLYNSDYEDVHGVKHASRSIVWLEPDHIVVYDRARTGTDGRFKRFWLQLPAAATVSGARATVRSRGGQQLFVNSLLPAGADITSERHDAETGMPAVAEPMAFRLKVEAPGAPKEARFLHVLQGADAGAAADDATLVRSRSGTPYDGATVAGTAVLFPVDLRKPFDATTVELPAAGLERILVMGLEPGAGYSVATEKAGTTVRVSVERGGDKKADSGGVVAAAA